MEKILSIVIPAYNVEKYLERCLASFEVTEILDQIEVLVINDGSKDQTAAIAQRYCDRYPDSYFLYNKENGGHGSGINYGIRYARGKYFKVVDGDDWLNTEELPAFVELLAQVDTDVVAADFLCVQDGTEQTLSEKHATSSREQYGCTVDLTAGGVTDVIKMHALTIRTRILQEYDIVIDEHCYYVDCEYITYPIPYVKTVYFYPKFIYMYRLGRNGQSMDIRSMQKNREQHMRFRKISAVWKMRLKHTTGSPKKSLKIFPEVPKKYIKKRTVLKNSKKLLPNVQVRKRFWMPDVSNGRKKRKNAVPATSLFSKRGIISLKRHRCLIKSVSVCAVRQKKLKSSGNPRFPICGKNMKSHRTMPFSTEKRS